MSGPLKDTEAVKRFPPQDRILSTILTRQAERYKFRAAGTTADMWDREATGIVLRR